MSSSDDDPNEGGTEKEDEGGEVYGTKFFGGSAVKEELFDPVLEDRAAQILRQKISDRDKNMRGYYDRFKDRATFEDDTAEMLGRRIQGMICRTLDQYAREDDDEGDGEAEEEEEGYYDADRFYSPSMRWETPFALSVAADDAALAGGAGAGGGGGRAATTTITNPMKELRAAKGFYNRVDAAVTGAKTLSSSPETGTTIVAMRWEISLVWPNPWESRVLLTGESEMTLSGAGTAAIAAADDDGPGKGDLVVTSQIDALDGEGNDSILGAVGKQLTPRFWDLYHIGMTPSAEISPRLPPRRVKVGGAGGGGGGGKGGGLLSSYDIYDTPPRLMLRPKLADARGGRDGRAAQALPNHAFSTAIKTMGPRKQRYVPAVPVEVSISKKSYPSPSLSPSSSSSPSERSSSSNNRPEISWNVPVSVEFLANAGEGGMLPLPGPDEQMMDEDDDDYSSATCAYELRPRRTVATVPYSGSPQDEEVSELRRKLYESVVRDGHVPELESSSGTPKFFFVQNEAKACYVPGGGLGMTVYEWRPKFSRSNEIGIELDTS